VHETEATGGKITGSRGEGAANLCRKQTGAGRAEHAQEARPTRNLTDGLAVQVRQELGGSRGGKLVKKRNPEKETGEVVAAGTVESVGVATQDDHARDPTFGGKLHGRSQESGKSKLTVRTDRVSHESPHGHTPRGIWGKSPKRARIRM